MKKKLIAIALTAAMIAGLAACGGSASGGSTDSGSGASGGSVRILYLCSSGADISRKTEIFSLVFMTVSQGSSDLSFNVSDCVDSDVRQMSIGECASGRITVREAARSNNNSSASKTKNKSGSVSDGGKSKASKAEKKLKFKYLAS